MTEYYEVPGGIAWCKANLRMIVGNKSLDDIMAFGDAWRSRGHRPLVHVIGPAMDGGKMWDNHVDLSGLLDNIPAHIDMAIVDFYNRETPELPKVWDGMTSHPKWLLWEYKAGSVRFNGDHTNFVQTFGIDPEAPPETQETQGTLQPQQSTSDGSVLNTAVQGTDADIHMVCPHCGKTIYLNIV